VKQQATALREGFVYRGHVTRRDIYFDGDLFISAM
jgi:hypothetical protein